MNRNSKLQAITNIHVCPPVPVHAEHQSVPADMPRGVRAAGDGPLRPLHAVRPLQLPPSTVHAGQAQPVPEGRSKKYQVRAPDLLADFC